MRVAPLLLLLLPLGAYATPASLVAPRKLDPNVTRAISTGVLGGSQRGPRHIGEAKVLLELVAPANDATLALLESLGARLARREGHVLFYDRFVPATLDGAAAAKLAARPELARISLAGARGPMPLDRSAQLVRLADARGARPELDELTGKGITIGDADTAVDVYEPTFFRGDAGYFDWIDVDHDGKFTPGKDAIDLDRDGKAGAGETAILLSATTRDFYGSPVSGRDPAFDPSIDWLFLDTNGNGKRDYGTVGGYTDSTPAFGEPLFVPDDLNKSGTVDVGERMVQLGTSKFRAIDVSLSAPFSVSATYTRGTNMASAKIDFTGGALYGFADALHATGVSTILVGDVPLVGRRWVGIAPDADLVISFDNDQGVPIEGATWLLMQKPDVMLYELAPWTGFPLDGSDPLSTIIEAAPSITHTCPTGDQGSALKHAHAQLAAAAMSTLPLDVPANAKEGTTPLSEVEITLNVRGGTPSALTLTGPKGDAYDILVDNNGVTLASGATIFVTTQTSTRGTALFDAVLYTTDSSQSLDVGTWTVSMTGGSSALTVDAYVSDDQSSWAVGAAWDVSVAAEVSTIGVPSVADNCIAVNAQPDHVDTNGKQTWFDMYYADYNVPTGYMDADLMVTAYSPRGPRIDGVMKPDVTAPDNPWVAMATTTGPYGSFSVFGGTSGAAPHVTGVAALLAQAGVRGAAAATAIRKGAATSGITEPLPNGDYGYGRLDAAGALGVTTTGEDFTVTLAPASLRSTVGHATLVATPVGDADAIAGVMVKWDDNYDGTWDTDYGTSLTYDVPAHKAGAYVVKVRARNASGHVAEAIATIDVVRASGCGCELGGRNKRDAAMGFVLVLSLVIWRCRTRRERL